MNLVERIANGPASAQGSWTDRTLQKRADSIRAAIAAQDKIIRELEQTVRASRSNPSALKHAQLRLSSAYSYRALKFSELGPILAQTGHIAMLHAEMARHA